MEINDDNLLELLLPYQLPHLQQLNNAFKKNQVILDASDTGTGKTYTSVALIKMLKLKPLIICPKSVINSWLKVIKMFNLEILGISNYEALKCGKMYNESMEYIKCPFINKIIESDKKHTDSIISNNKSPSINLMDGSDNKKIKEDTEDKEDKEDKYEFIIPTFAGKEPNDLINNFIIVFDEAHRCKNFKTTNSKILIAAYQAKIKILLLSATISDKIECFKPFGYILGYYDKINTYNIWLRRQLMVFKVLHDKTNFTEDQKRIDIIHRRLFPNKGSRMKISLLGNLFPSNQIINQTYYLADHDKINKLYQEMNQALADLKVKELRATALGRIIRCRQHIEILKVPIFLELAEDAIENGYNVAIFVNFHETLEHLAFQLDADCFIHGKQGLEERIQCIEDFQSNKKNIIIAIIQAGSVGISLHDLHGTPRMSLISPTWSGQDLVQCLGRIHRAGAKTPAQQKIILCADTYEEQISKIIQKKLTNISGINDCDLNGPNFDQEYFELIDNNLKNKENVIVVDSKSKKEVKEKNNITKKVVKNRSTKSINNIIDL